MIDHVQLPTLPLGICRVDVKHSWSVAAWADIEPDADNPGRGRAAVAFFCTKCLAQVDAATLYAPAAEPDGATEPAPDSPPSTAAYRFVLSQLADRWAEQATINPDDPEARLAHDAIAWAAGVAARTP